MPPANGADAQRVRVMLPFLARHNWKATVVAVDDDSGRARAEPELLEAAEANAEILRVRPWPLGLAGRLGIRQPALRSWLPVRRRLERLFRERRFDAAFVSTTDFPLWTQTARWPMPVVLDWQDPWLSDYYEKNPSVTPPGGRWRFGVMQAIARRHEPRVARSAAAHVTVSPAYVDMLRKRYPDIPADRFAVVPFAVSRNDIELARTRCDAMPSRRYWTYVGRGGPDMRRAATAFFDALSRARSADPARFADLRVRFIGTAYDPTSLNRQFEDWAEKSDVGELVEEQPARVGYLEMLRLLDESEALVVPGSDDAAYNASKLAPYIATGKPLLGIFHRDSVAHQIAGVHPSIRLVSFGLGDDVRSCSDSISRNWFEPGIPSAVRSVELGPLDAANMSAALAAVFDRVVPERAVGQ